MYGSQINTPKDTLIVFEFKNIRRVARTLLESIASNPHNRSPL